MTRLLRFRLSACFPLLALGLVTLLGGCVVYPGDAGYGYRPVAYYPPAVIEYGHGGWGHHRHGW